MSKKYRRFYETAFDSNISKSDEDLLSADKRDAAIAHRLSDQLHLSASTNSVRQRCDGGGGSGATAATTTAVGATATPPSASGSRPKNRLFAFLRRRGRKYQSTDSVATGSSLSLESITSDSLSSHSSESPCYKRYPEPHVLSPISDKSSQDAVAETLLSSSSTVDHHERRRKCAPPVKTKPPQSLGLIKLNRDHQQLHGSDSGISVGSKPGDNYQELLDVVPFDMPKLRRKQTSEQATDKLASSLQGTDDLRPPRVPPQPPSQLPLADLPFDMPKLRRRQIDPTNSDAALPFDMPKLRKRQMDSCARVLSLDFEVHGGVNAFGSSGVDAFGSSGTGAFGSSGPGAFGSSGTGAFGFSGLHDNRSKCERLEELPFDIPKLKNLHSNDENAKKPDRSSLFLDVKPNVCAAVNANNRPSLKTFQNKNQSNRPTLSLSNIKPLNFVEDIDVSLPLDQQCWYHGPMNRLEAEKILCGQGEGSYLVRGIKGSYALSIKSAKGFIHMRITQSGESNYLGQSDRPFETIPDLIRHYTLNRLPAKGAEHVGLIRPLAHQIL